VGAELAGYALVDRNVNAYQVSLTSQESKDGNFAPMNHASGILDSLSGKGKLSTKRITLAQKQVAVKAAVTVGLEMLARIRPEILANDRGNAVLMKTVTRSLIDYLDIVNNLYEEKDLSQQVRQDVHIVVLASLACAARLGIKDPLRSLQEVFALQTEPEIGNEIKKVLGLVERITTGGYVAMVEAAVGATRVPEVYARSALEFNTMPFSLYLTEKQSSRYRSKPWIYLSYNLWKEKMRSRVPYATWQQWRNTWIRQYAPDHTGSILNNFEVYVDQFENQLASYLASSQRGWGGFSGDEAFSTFPQIESYGIDENEIVDMAQLKSKPRITPSVQDMEKNFRGDVPLALWKQWNASWAKRVVGASEPEDISLHSSLANYLLCRWYPMYLAYSGNPDAFLSTLPEINDYGIDNRHIILRKAKLRPIPPQPRQRGKEEEHSPQLEAAAAAE